MSVVPVVLDAMKFNVDNVTIQKLGLRVLLNISNNQTDFEAFVAADCVGIIAEAMMYHPKDDAICNAAILLLAMITARGGDAWRTVQSNSAAVYAVINAMLAFPENKKLLEDGMIIIYGLSDDAEGKDSLFNLGGVEALAQAMRYNKDNINVQAQGVKVFHRLLFDGERVLSSDSTLPRAVISAVVCAMNAVIHLSSLQCEAVTLLRVLCSRDEVLVRLALEYGALDALLSAAQVHADSASVQVECFDFLHTLLTCVESCSLIASSNCIAVILYGMAKHVKEKTVQETGTFCLRAMLSDKGCRSIIRRCGGLKTVMLTMSIYPNQVILQENTLAIVSELWSDLADNDCNAFAIDSDINTIVNSIIGCPRSADVQRLGCICLYNISKISLGNRAAIQRCSVLLADALISACERFPQECSTLTCTLLEIIMDSS